MLTVLFLFVWVFALTYAISQGYVTDWAKDIADALKALGNTRLTELRPGGQDRRRARAQDAAEHIRASELRVLEQETHDLRSIPHVIDRIDAELGNPSEAWVRRHCEVCGPTIEQHAKNAEITRRRQAKEQADNASANHADAVALWQGASISSQPTPVARTLSPGETLEASMDFTSNFDVTKCEVDILPASRMVITDVKGRHVNVRFRATDASGVLVLRVWCGRDRAEFKARWEWTTRGLHVTNLTRLG